MTTNDIHAQMLLYRNSHNYTEAIKLKNQISFTDPTYKQTVENYGICLYYDGQIEEAYDIFCLLINNQSSAKDSNDNINRYHYNRHFCISKVFRNYENYQNRNITKKDSNYSPVYTFTITTCKRLDLFKRTMNSFLNCCKDLHLIDRWICVDDNSSQFDRNEMSRLYPFFEFYFKTPEEKGHANSMNILLKLIKEKGSKFVFHMEDDWEYFEPKNYITLCTEVLGVNRAYGQCLINRDYMETEASYSTRGSELKKTGTDLRYYEHVYSPGHYNFPNCIYWKHYSLRPSLLKYSVFEKLGNYNKDAGHFEAEYAERYYNIGYRSCFLEDIYCYHIGKLTSQKDIPNAYTLNQEKQFGEINGFDMERIKVQLINLDRRSDRLESFMKQPWPLTNKVNKFSAIDGKKVISSPDLVKLFKHNDYNYRTGIVGCALSHIKLWCDLLKDSCDYYLVLEDDAVITPFFTQENIIKILTQTKNIDLLYLGHHPNNKEEKDALEENKELSIIIRKTQECFKTSWGGTFCYIISKVGARKLLDYINTYSVTNGIDWVMMKASDVLTTGYLYPAMVKSDCFVQDSDIHHNRDVIHIDETHIDNYTEYMPESYNIDHILPITIHSLEQHSLEQQFKSIVDLIHHGC